MKTILWCPQHSVSQEQAAELAELYPGRKIVTLQDVDPELFKQLKDCPGDRTQLYILAGRLRVRCMEAGVAVMPIGSPVFQAIFFQQEAFGNTAFLFAHSTRESVEQQQPDGSVKKVSVFRHQKFITL